MQLSDPDCSYLLYIFLQVEKNKSLLTVFENVQGLNSAILMTNGIRTVRQGVDIFDI